MIKSIFYSSDSVKGSRRSPSDPTNNSSPRVNAQKFKRSNRKTRISSEAGTRTDSCQSLNVTFSTGPVADEVDESQGIARFISYPNLSKHLYVANGTLFVHVRGCSYRFWIADEPRKKNTKSCVLVVTRVVGYLNYTRKLAIYASVITSIISLRIDRYPKIE